MPGLVVTLSGNALKYEAMLARSVKQAEIAGAKIQATFEARQAYATQKGISVAGPIGAAEIAIWRKGQAEWNKIQAEKTAAMLSNFEKQRQAALKLEAEMTAANLLVARGHGASAFNPSGGHGAGGITGIIRESLVIVRELSMGRGLGRVAGSVTLLAQYMGLLGKVVKSTASEQLLASIAASKLSQSMAAEAEAARGTVAFSGLLAKARKQEEIATKAATEAEIALQTAKVSVNPLGWAIIAGAAVTAVLVGWAWHLHTLAVRAKNLADALDPLKKKFTELAEERDRAAKAAQENADWLSELTNRHQAESEQIERKIRLLRMEAEARGWTKKQTAEKEKALLLAEQARLDAEEKAAIAAEKSAAEAQSAGAHGKDFTTGEVIDTKQAADKAKLQGEILDAVEAAFKANPSQISMSSMANVLGGPVSTSRPTSEHDAFTVKVDGKEMTLTLAQAKENFKKSSDQAEKLAADQKALDDVLKNTRSTAKEKHDALVKVQGDLSQIGDEAKFGYGKDKGGRLDVTDRERIGLGAASSIQVSMLDVARKSEIKLGQTVSHLETLVKISQANAGGFE